MEINLDACVSYLDDTLLSHHEFMGGSFISVMLAIRPNAIRRTQSQLT